MIDFTRKLDIQKRPITYVTHKGFGNGSWGDKAVSFLKNLAMQNFVLSVNLFLLKILNIELILLRRKSCFSCEQNLTQPNYKTRINLGRDFKKFSKRFLLLENAETFQNYEIVLKQKSNQLTELINYCLKKVIIDLKQLCCDNNNIYLKT